MWRSRPTGVTFMVCKYLDDNLKCTGKYAGFACIKGQCFLFKEARDKLLNCPHSVEKGLYCTKYKSFLCTMGNCATYAEYLESLANMEKELVKDRLVVVEGAEA